MDQEFSSTLDNSSEALDNATFNSTTTGTPTTSSLSIRQSVSATAVAAVGFVVMGVGCCANSVVIAVLMRARREFGSSVHTLITNQSVLDLFACVAGMAMMITMIAHGYSFYGAICVLFEGMSLAAFGMTAEIMGLIVITVERYFKIVHAIAHRKYYRHWMTKLGLALPWIVGICSALLPAFVTTRIVNGRCLRFGVWANEASKMAFVVSRFIWYVIPFSVFVYCYGRIFHTIRRQSKVVSGHSDSNQAIAMTTTSRDQNTGQILQQATGASSVTKLSRTEMNVLKTMIIVVVCFIIFWTVPVFVNILRVLGMQALDYNAFALSASLVFCSFTVNPFIYASRYEVFRRYLKQMMNKNNIG